MNNRMQPMPEDHFLALRSKVLDTWATGAEAVDFGATIAYHRENVPPALRFHEVLRTADAENRTLLQPRAGVSVAEEHIKLLRRLQDEGGADLLPTTIDSYTRQNRYEDAQRGLEESRRVGRSMLNGFPAVNLGVAACRRVVESMNRPIQVRHGTPDARLLAEITLAAGFTAFEGGGISYNIPYTKGVPLERSIADWQYVDRLVGRLAEQGVTINREPFGPLTGTLVPPCVAIAVNVLEALLAAEQGVKHLTLGYGQNGYLPQDVGALHALRRVGRDYLDHYGFGDVELTTVLHQWMGGFPQDEAQSFGVICWGTATGYYAGATKIITKSPHEALGVPTGDANAAGLRASRQILNMLHTQPRFDTPEIQEEEVRAEKEARAMIDAAMRLGENRPADAAIRGFEAGVLDIPFAPSLAARGSVIPVRDLSGAVRLLEFGALPMDKETKAFHRDRIAQRAKAEHRRVSFQLVTDDIYAISKGRLVGTPR